MVLPPLISDAASLLRQEKLSPLDLLEACFERIDALDDKTRAWVCVDRQGARQAACIAGEELTRGEDRGPLHGIPLGVKDIIDTRGLPTTAGSPLRVDRVAREDAPIVAALRRAGAVLVGKTVTVEFACFDPSPTLNPWDPSGRHTPGGSSSGSAAAVALGMCLGALGTQTGGSLVRPSSYCGIATIKPTFGRVETAGIVPVSFHLDHPGPMARSIDDLILMLPPLLSDDMAEQVEPIEPDHPARLGVPETFFVERADRAMRRAFQMALGRIRAAGAQVEPVALPDDFADTLDLHTRIMAVEAADYHGADFAEHRNAYGPMIASLLEEGLTISGIDYARALAHQRSFGRRIGSIFEGFDALIMPATDTTAPPSRATTGPKTFQAPWSYAGVPVVSLPCGLADDTMPAAVQLVAPRHHDTRLLGVARWCERVFAFSTTPLGRWER